MDDEIEDIVIEERNRHYYDATKNYTLRIEGNLAITINPQELEKDNLTNEDLEALINDADTSADVTEKAVYAPDHYYNE